MEDKIKLSIVKTCDDKTQFIVDKITITVSRFYYYKGKHYIVEAKTAKAEFECYDERHIVGNTENVSTIENWYLGTLLPRMQMLSLLNSKEDMLNMVTNKAAY